MLFEETHIFLFDSYFLYEARAACFCAIFRVSSQCKKMITYKDWHTSEFMEQAYNVQLVSVIAHHQLVQFAQKPIESDF